MKGIRIASALVLAAASACGDDGGKGADAAPVADAAGSDASAPDAAAAEVTLTTYVDWTPTPATWVAMQEGDGPWQRIDSDDGQYRFLAPSGRYSVAVLCDEAQRHLFITRATVAELPSLWHGCVRGGTGQLQVTLEGAPEGPIARVHVGTSSQGATAAAPAVMFPVLPPGRYDLVASFDPNDDGRPDELAFLRDVAIADGSTASATIDGTDAIATSSFSFTVDSDDPDVERRVFLVTGGTRLLLNAPDARDGGSYRGLPASALADGDRHLAYAKSSVNQHGASTWAYFRDARNLDFELPPAFTVSSVSTAATTPSVRVEASFDAYPDASFYELAVGHIRILATAGWLGDGERYTLEQPDLSEADGWQNAWALADGVGTHYEGSAFTGDIYPGYVKNSDFNFRASGVKDGAMATRAYHSGAFTP